MVHPTPASASRDVRTICGHHFIIRSACFQKLRRVQSERKPGFPPRCALCLPFGNPVITGNHYPSTLGAECIKPIGIRHVLIEFVTQMDEFDFLALKYSQGLHERAGNAVIEKELSVLDSSRTRWHRAQRKDRPRTSQRRLQGVARRRDKALVPTPKPERDRNAKTPPKKSGVEVLVGVGEIESHRTESNCRPLDYESRALPLSYGGNAADNCG